MLTPEMTQKLNEQLNLEFYSANLYLQMSAWCSDKGFEGAASFLKEHSQEEMQHMQRLFEYLSDTGSLPLLGSIAAPPVEFASLADVFQQTYEHEQLITRQINETGTRGNDCPRLLYLQLPAVVCCRAARRREAVQIRAG